MQKIYHIIIIATSLCTPIAAVQQTGKTTKRHEEKHIQRKQLKNAVKNGNIATTNILLSQNSESLVHNGMYLAHRAAQYGHTNILRSLRNYNIDMDTPDRNNNMCPIHIALYWREYKAAQFFIKHNININTPMKNGATPAHMSAYTGDGGTLQMLANHGAHLMKCDENGLAPIHYAAQHGHAHIIQTLAHHNNRSKISTQYDNNGFAPVHHAAKNGKKAAIQALARYRGRAAVTIRSKNESFTPLHCAAIAGQDQLVSLCAQLYAPHNVDIRDNKGNTPLYYAVSNGNEETIRYLCEWGASPYLPSNTQNPISPLAQAINNDDRAVLYTLLTHNAQPRTYPSHYGVDTIERDGKSLIYKAIRNNNPEAVCLLIQYGRRSQKSYYNTHKQQARDIARSYNDRRHDIIYVVERLDRAM